MSYAFSLISENATYIAAPAAGGVMADWGAEVIKVEPLGGCPMRNFFATAMTDDYPDNPIFALDNRGKRALAVNTSTDEGTDIVRKLIEHADVFLTNVRPGQLEKQGLDFDTLHAINPKMIYASVTGFGLEGDERDKPGLLFRAVRGLMATMAKTKKYRNMQMMVDMFGYGRQPLHHASKNANVNMLRALHAAGATRDSLRGALCGAFVGMMSLDAAQLLDKARIGPYDLTGNGYASAGSRLSFVFDLKGPTSVVDTACSSALVALDAGVLSLRAGCSEAALAAAAARRHVAMGRPARHLRRLGRRDLERRVVAAEGLVAQLGVELSPRSSSSRSVAHQSIFVAHTGTMNAHCLDSMRFN